MTDSMREHALRLAELGYYVFPIWPKQKTPLFGKDSQWGGWRDHSTTNADVVSEWWTDHAPDANIGIDCGRSGVFVIDIDELDEFEPMEAELGTLPETQCVITGKGVHLYYRAADGLGNSAKTLWPGVDTRGDGGYVIAPPSVHPDGSTYDWHTGLRHAEDLELLPDAYVKKLARPEPAAAPAPAVPSEARSAWGQSILESETGKVAMALEGQRNQTLFDAALRVLSAVKGGHIDREVADAALTRAGQAAGLTLTEIARTLESAWDIAVERHPTERPFEPPAPAEPAPEPAQAGIVGDVIELAAAQPRTQGFEVLNLEQLAELPPPRWLLNQRIPEGLTILYGDPGAGKTFVSIDWTLTIAALTGRPVIYFAGEGVSGLRLRVDAWKLANPQLNPATWTVVPSVPRLLDPEQARLLADTCARHQPALIVIDTLARSLVGGDENSSLDVGMAVDALDRLRQQHGTSSLILHHSAKNQPKERGSGALRGAADAMWRLGVSPDSELHLTCEKLKDGNWPHDSYHMLRQVGESAVLHRPTHEVVR